MRVYASSYSIDRSAAEGFFEKLPENFEVNYVAVSNLPKSDYFESPEFQSSYDVGIVFLKESKTKTVQESNLEEETQKLLRLSVSAKLVVVQVVKKGMKSKYNPFNSYPKLNLDRRDLRFEGGIDDIARRFRRRLITKVKSYVQQKKVSKTDAPVYFICHSEKDQLCLNSTTTILNDLGFQTWYSSKNINGSGNWGAQIARAIKNANGFIVIVSENLRDSAHCEREGYIALDNGKKIFAFDAGASKLSDAWEYLLGGLQRPAIECSTKDQGTISIALR